jgi:hypothetical protein
VAEGGRALGTLDGKLYGRLYEVKTAGLPLDVVVTIHRVPERPLRYTSASHRMPDAASRAVNAHVERRMRVRG